MAHVAVRATFRYARHYRQDRLLAIERLDLALLVDAENEGAVGRGQVKADNIAYLVDEQRIVRQLERLAAVRLQAEGHPHAANRGVGKAGFRRHRADRPMRCVDRRGAQRAFDYRGDLIVADGSGSTGTRLVKQTIAAVLQKSTAPLANRVFVNAEFRSHLLTGQAVRTSQNDATSLRQRPSNAATTNLPFQVCSFLRSQYQSRGRTASHTSICHKRPSF